MTKALWGWAVRPVSSPLQMNISQKAGRTHSSSTLPACDRETSRQLDRRRMWQLARRKSSGMSENVTMEINGRKKKKKRENKKP